MMSLRRAGFSEEDKKAARSKNRQIQQARTAHYRRQARATPDFVR
jgi:hypothetical protein